jgi:transketolase
MFVLLSLLAPTPTEDCRMTDAPVGRNDTVDALCVNTLRVLAMEAVEKAKSGHPGAPMGQAAIGYAVWTRHLRHNPANPSWPGRDRFVLSCGHASMLLYGLLYLTGYDVTLDDIRGFRQWESRTPGHPEFGETPGVETTTGPLGQGIGNAVGMALAARHLAAQFNRPDHDLFRHRVYFLAGDGDLMEGVSHEAASLAGHLRLGNLIGIYDDNRVTIDGSTSLTYSEEVVGRFDAYGWQVLRVEDGNDLAAIDEAVLEAAAESHRPSLIVARTHIAYGSPNKQDTSAAHGAPLGDEEIQLTKESLGWPYEQPFTVPDEALVEWRRCVDRGAALEGEWNEVLERYQAMHPQLARELQRRLDGTLPEGWERELPSFEPSDGPMATRKASGKVLNALAPVLPELLGGSADLAGSNNTTIRLGDDLGPENPGGRNVHFGVREHAMGAIMNGMALHGGFIPYGGTFLVFSDYMRPAIRLAALMGLRLVYVFTHDSIGVGEDGPTHQPVEMLTALRAIPNLTVVRPADAAETTEAWRVAITNTSGPTALILTRQSLRCVERGESAPAARLREGAYVLSAARGSSPDVLLLASGSEVGLALDAQQQLLQEGISATVVSVPSIELFMRQPRAYRDQVLPPEVPCRLAIEAAEPTPWWRWVGERGDVMGIERFGASAPASRLFEAFGFTVDEVCARIHRMVDA